MSSSTTVYSNALLERSFSRPVAFIEQARAWIAGPSRRLTENPGTVLFDDYGCRPSFSLEFRKKSLLFGRCDDYGMALGKVSEITYRDRDKYNLTECVEELLNGLPAVYSFNVILSQDSPVASQEIAKICLKIHELRLRISNYQVDSCCRLITLKLNDIIMRKPLPISHFQLNHLKNYLNITPPIHIRRNMNFRQFDDMLSKDMRDWLMPSEDCYLPSSSIFLSISVTSTPFGTVYAQAEKSLRHQKTSLAIKTIVKLFEVIDKILSNVDQLDLKISCSFQMDSYEDVVRIITTNFSHRLPNTSGHCFCGFTSSCQTYHYSFNNDLYRIFLHQDRSSWLLIMNKIKADTEIRFRMEQMAILSSLDRQSVSLGLIELWKSFYLYMSKQHRGDHNRFEQNDNETYLLKPSLRRCNSCFVELHENCFAHRPKSSNSHRRLTRRRSSTAEERLLHPLRDSSNEFGTKSSTGKPYWNDETDKLRLSYCHILAFAKVLNKFQADVLTLNINDTLDHEKMSLKLSKTDIRQFFAQNSSTHERFLQDNIRILCQPIRRIIIDPFCFPAGIVKDILKQSLQYGTTPSSEVIQLNFCELDGYQKELRIFEAFPIQLIDMYDFASFHISRQYTPRRLTKFLEENPDLSDYWFIPIRPRSYNYLSIFVNAAYPKSWFPNVRRTSRTLRLLEYLVFPIGQIMKCLPKLLKSITYFYFEIDGIPSWHILTVLSQYLVLNLKWEKDTSIYAGCRRTFHRRIYDEMFLLTLEPTPKQSGQYRLYIHRKNEDYRILQYLRSNDTPTSSRLPN